MSKKFKKCKKKCIKFEEEFGAIELLKSGVSVINRILVESGVTTEEEIRDLMMEEIDKRIKEDEETTEMYDKMLDD